jgi:CRISPR-associated protein Cmx8
LAKTKNATAVEVLTLDYQLAELPSSQHRAGLAGLGLIIRWLERQPEFQKKIADGAICRLTYHSDGRGAILEVNQAGLEILFDEIYAATMEQTRSTKLRTKKNGEIIQPIAEDEEEILDKKTGKPKIDKKTGQVQTKKIYIYPVVVPKGSFLSDEQYDKTPHGEWTKLWRNALWEILKGKPATRLPFNARVDGACKDDSSKVWVSLTNSLEKTVELPGSFFLGAQARNAEVIPFQDVTRFQFLLHFWFYCASIYVPQKTKFEKDKENKKFVEKPESIGYAIAIPDITELELFCDEFLEILKDRSSEVLGYRPKDAIVDLAIESALDTMKRLKDRLVAREGDKATNNLVSGFDVIHAKPGEDVKFLGIMRIKPDFAMVDRYSQIRNGYWNPLFRKQRLLNLVNHHPWYQGFDKLLCSLPYEQSIENDYFRRDVREAFQHEVEQMDESIMNGEQVNDAKLDELVFQLVRNYVGRKLESKYQLKWSEVKDKPDKKKDYEEMKQKVAKDAFLAVRSRTEKMDFINYFASTLCSVPQYLKSEDYLSLTQALYSDHDRIRTLTLLALSANS